MKEDNAELVELYDYRLKHLKVATRGVRDVEEEKLANQMDELGGLPDYTSLKYQSEEFWPWDEVSLDDISSADASGELGGVSISPERTVDEWDSIPYNEKTLYIEVISQNGERRDIIDIPDIR